jgi:hypothetical protein
MMVGRLENVSVQNYTQCWTGGLTEHGGKNEQANLPHETSKQNLRKKTHENDNLYFCLAVSASRLFISLL